MTLLYQDAFFAAHETGSHPERPLRVTRVAEHLEQTGYVDKCNCPAWQPATEAELQLVHNPEYVLSVRQYADDGGGRIETDTVVSDKSYAVALRAAGAVCDAVKQVVGGEAQNALCLVRPPGHHALPKAAMGFCLFNNIAVAARLATQQLDLDRVLIVDWDVHHGNGTQDAFWADEQVGFFSIHRHPFYPGTGMADETGTGAALGTTRNVPVRFGTDRSEYFERFASELESFAAKIRPQLVLISAGFDSHRLDPIGSLGLEQEDFGQLTRHVLKIADEYADGKTVSVLEGGYNVDVLPACIEQHLQVLLG